MIRRIDEQDEFLLSRLLDNDLAAEEASALQARLEREPQLRQAYAAMTRLDTLLMARRADQPQVDWTRFHREVMDQVEAEAVRPITIRLAHYLRVAVPLAAAAAIALVVILWPRGSGGPIPPKGGPTGVQIALNEPTAPTNVAPGASIEYHRPGSIGADDEIRVSFARSDEVTREYQLEDAQSRSRESSVIASVDKRVPARPPVSGLLAQALMFE